MAVRDVKELTVYIKADHVAMEVHAQLTSRNSEVGKMLRSMYEHPEKFLLLSA